VLAGTGGKRVFVGWGDGHAFYGSVVRKRRGRFTTTPVREYVRPIRQYYYQVVWLPRIKRFLAIVAGRDGGSTVCTIDLKGRVDRCAASRWRILREARPAAGWDAGSNSYTVLFPIGKRSLAKVRVSAGSIEDRSRMTPGTTPALRAVTWQSTGTWGLFAGVDLALFATNRSDGDDVTLAAIPVGH